MTLAVVFDYKGIFAATMAVSIEAASRVTHHIDIAITVAAYSSCPITSRSP